MPAKTPTTQLFDRRFVINTGKGGVGKTTVSVALALAWAKRGKRVLLMQFNARDRIGPLFGKPPVGPDIVEVRPGLSVVNSTPHDAMHEYAMMVVGKKAIYRTVFQNKWMDKLLRMMPGLPELTLLGKAYYHEKETDVLGRKKWDVVIIDAPATGHGMFLLQIPRVITSALSTGRMANESSRMLELLEDPERTVINLITLPEELPVAETLELRANLQREFRIAIGAVFANAVIDTPFLDAEVAAMSAARGRCEAESPLAELLDATLFQAERVSLQRQNLRRLTAELGTEPVRLPLDVRFDEPMAVIESVCDAIQDQVPGFRLATRGAP